MAGDINSEQLMKALDEVEEFLQELEPRKIEPDDITPSRIAARTGRLANNVKVQLDRLVLRGKLVCVGKVKAESGQHVTAYRLVRPEAR